MKQLTIMIKPASSLCNLRCRYCFYADVSAHRSVSSFGIMTPQTRRNLLRNIRTGLAAGDRLTFAFQGGEPTLAGLPWFRDFTDETEQWTDIHVRYALQTNATLLDEDWCAYLKQKHFLVGISWDLLPECHNAARVDAKGKGTDKQVLKAIGLLEKCGVEYNVLCTLTNLVARHPEKVWSQLLKQQIRYVQFTPCLDALDAPQGNPYALTPARFAAFYSRLFALWYPEYEKGRYRSVKLFDDIVNLLAYGIPTACGIDGHCRPQIVVEADGSVYPCDFYCVDACRMGNLAKDSLQSLLESPAAASFLARPHTQPGLCADCPYSRLCGGGCKRMQQQVCCAQGSLTCGYRTFLSVYLPQLRRIAAECKRP